MKIPSRVAMTKLHYVMFLNKVYNYTCIIFQMPRAYTKVCIVEYDTKQQIVDHQLFETHWDAKAACNAHNTAFFEHLTRNLARTQFGVCDAQQLKNVFNTLHSTQMSKSSKLPTPMYERIQLSSHLACRVLSHFQHQINGSLLEVCNGSLTATYNTSPCAHQTNKIDKLSTSEIDTDLPAQCITFTGQDGSVVIINSWSFTNPGIKALKRASASRGPRQTTQITHPFYAQHFITTNINKVEQASKQAKLVSIQSLKYSNNSKHINRNVQKLNTFAIAQSHRDTRIMSKAEHNAMRLACGFTDDAWQHAVLTSSKHCSVWSTTHNNIDARVVSLILH